MNNKSLPHGKDSRNETPLTELAKSQDKITVKKNVDYRKENRESTHGVIAIFSVKFDVHRGNIIEWQYPKDFDLEGVEYQALCSGLHRVESDIIYFTRLPFYGVSVFDNVSTESDRGAKMTALGVLTVPKNEDYDCGWVWEHVEYLKEMTRRRRQCVAGDNSFYGELVDYYQTNHAQSWKAATVVPEPSLKLPLFPIYSDHDVTHDLNHILYHHTKHALNVNAFKSNFPSSKPAHPSHCFPETIRQFGPSIFVLWKACLLKKRIIIVAQPPMEWACRLAYCIGLLGIVPKYYAERELGSNKSGPRFCIGVNDIEHMENLSSYIACTPDAIFQTKTDLYDVLVTLQPSAESMDRLPHIISSDESSSPEPNVADIARFRILWRIFNEAQVLLEDDNLDEERRLERLLAAKQNKFQTCIDTGLQDALVWLYGSARQDTTANASWQQLFAGSTPPTRSKLQGHTKLRQLSLQKMSIDPEEQQALLLGTDSTDLEPDEQDATEINNNDVFQALAARSSNEVHPSIPLPEPASQLTENDDIQSRRTMGLISFFHVLTRHMLLTLKYILSQNEEDEVSGVFVYPSDMIRLGLDPRKDKDFLRDLAWIYFGKRIHISCCGPLPNRGLSCIPCCGSRQDGNERHVRL